VVCIGVSRLGDGLHVQGMKRVSRGLCLMYLGFVLRPELLVSGSFCAVVCGAVLGSCKGGLVACPEAMQFHLVRSESLSLCVCIGVLVECNMVAVWLPRRMCYTVRCRGGVCRGGLAF